MEVRNPDFSPEDRIGPEFWERFLLLSERAGRFMRLYTELAPEVNEYRRTGIVAPDLAERVDLCVRGMEHFLPFIEKYTEFMRMVNETPMELVDPEILAFLDTIG